MDVATTLPPKLIPPRQKVEFIVTQAIDNRITVLCDKTWYIMLPSGTYDVLNRSDRGSTGMGVLRQMYEDKWGEKPTWSYVIEALGHLHQYQPSPPPSVKLVDAADFNRAPLYRMIGDARTFRLGLNPGLAIEDVAATLTLEDRVAVFELWDSAFNDEDQSMWDKVITHYGAEWFLMAAWLMLEPRKVICVISAPTSNAGKSTFVDMLAGAFPDWVAREDADEVFKRQQPQFPPLNKFLTQYRLLFLDEADKIESPPSARLVNSITNTTMTVREKHIPDAIKSRTGNACFIGAGDPNIELGQGGSTRFQWKIDANDLTELPVGLREWMLSPTGLHYARFHILSVAITLCQLGDSFCIPESGRQSAQAFVREVTDDPFTDILRRLYVEGNDEDKVMNESVKAAIKTFDQDIELPGGKAWGRAIRRVFPAAVSCQVGHPPKRGYQRLRLRTEGELGALEMIDSLVREVK